MFAVNNRVFTARLVRWLATFSSGPIVIPGEEITNPAYHLIAIAHRACGRRCSGCQRSRKTSTVDGAASPAFAWIGLPGMVVLRGRAG